MSFGQDYLALRKEARAEAIAERAKPLIDCPIDGTPLESARGWLNCPMGNFRVPAGTTKGQVAGS